MEGTTGVLTVFYSRKGENYFNGSLKSLEKGNSEVAARFIQEAVGGALFEIEPSKPYASDYHECCSEAKKELEQNLRPALKKRLESLAPYKTIFLVFPCWFSTLPMCVFTFLDSYDLTGKRIVPLCSNEGSCMGRSVTDLRSTYKSAVVLDGLAIRGCKTVESKDIIVAWAKKHAL